MTRWVTRVARACHGEEMGRGLEVGFHHLAMLSGGYMMRVLQTVRCYEFGENSLEPALMLHLHSEV